MSRLDELLARKRGDLARKVPIVSAPNDDRRIHWNRDRFRVIAEIKRSSLSAGSIRPALEPDVLAAMYEQAGAAAISVLTEQHYFGGSIEDLRQVRKATRVPLLQKDFVLEASQIFEAKQAGASFVLLIVRLLTLEQLKALLACCEELQMNALVEITQEADLEKLVGPVPFLGVNSRDLETLQIDNSKFAKLRPLLPGDSFLIAESGIANLRQLSDVMELGYHGALIGEHFLRMGDPAEEARKFVEFSGSTRAKICGITNEPDAILSVEAGAKALGFIFADSPRRIDPDILREFRGSIPEDVFCVGVFKGQKLEEIQRIMKEHSLDIAQIYDSVVLPGRTWQAYTIHSASEVPATKHAPILIDLKKEESEMPAIWKELANERVFALAGGLHPGNVRRAVEICRPQWVDVARGVEKEPGIKDPAKVKEFIFQSNIQQATIRGIHVS